MRYYTHKKTSAGISSSNKLYATWCTGKSNQKILKKQYNRQKMYVISCSALHKTMIDKIQSKTNVSFMKEYLNRDS
jgi:gluconate kinase